MSSKRRKDTKEFDWSKTSFGPFVLKIAYVGTEYHGLAWQDPAICPTVEGVLFEALMKTRLIKDRSSCNYSRCGRTDRGVHAAGNYVSLDMRLKTSNSDENGIENSFDYPAILNIVLPSSIRILAACPAPVGFNARFSCLYRAYQYYFPLNGEDLSRMRDAAELFIGEHDFRNFCKMDTEHVTHFRRRVLSVGVTACPGGVGEFAVTGVAFLWHQVRCMAAILLFVGRGLEEPSIVTDLLDVEQNPRKPTYDPANEEGLILRDCGFEGIPFAPVWPPPPAGAAGAGTLDAMLSTTKQQPKALESFQLMRDNARRVAAVHEVLASAVEAHSPDQSAHAKRPHIPLLSRPVGSSLEEKQEAFAAKKLRREALASSAASAADE